MGIFSSFKKWVKWASFETAQEEKSSTHTREESDSQDDFEQPEEYDYKTYTQAVLDLFLNTPEYEDLQKLVYRFCSEYKTVSRMMINAFARHILERSIFQMWQRLSRCTGDRGFRDYSYLYQDDIEKEISQDRYYDSLKDLNLLYNLLSDEISENYPLQWSKMVELFTILPNTVSPLNPVETTNAYEKSFDFIPIVCLTFHLLKLETYARCYFDDEKERREYICDKNLPIEEIVRRHIKVYILDCSNEIECDSFSAVEFLSNSLYYIGYYKEDDIHYCKLTTQIKAMIDELKPQVEYELLRKKLKEEPVETFKFPDIDSMTGIELEEFLVELFSRANYSIYTTKTTGDNGVDLIIEKHGIRTAIQAKCYSNSVGNSAVQEVVAGMAFYGCKNSMVITSNYFTKAAIELAKANNVVLWDRDKLLEQIKILW